MSILIAIGGVVFGAGAAWAASNQRITAAEQSATTANGLAAAANKLATDGVGEVVRRLDGLITRFEHHEAAMVQRITAIESSVREHEARYNRKLREVVATLDRTRDTLKSLVLWIRMKYGESDGVPSEILADFSDILDAPGVRASELTS